MDDFHFDGDQDLGYWNAKTNDVARTWVGSDVGSTRVSNASFRAWQQRNMRGGDYTNFSDILSRQVGFEFPSMLAELEP